MIYGYARCSTNESKQDIDRQVRELRAAGAESFYMEYEHGDAENKQELGKLFDRAVPGDTIIITEVTRISRSTKQLCDVIDLIQAKKLCLQVLGSITIDCRGAQVDPMTKAFLQIAGVFAELELAMIRARVRSGMANAKDKGVRIGRPQMTADEIPAAFFRHYPAFRQGALNVTELARVCDVSRTTVYKYLALVEG